MIQIPHLPEYETNFSFKLGYLKTQESPNNGILTKFHATVNDFTLPTILCMDCFDGGFCDCFVALLLSVQGQGNVFVSNSNL
jgi:hypothetical protein